MATAVVVLVPSAGHAARPSARDRIAYYSGYETAEQVYTVDLRGQHRRRLTRFGAMYAFHSLPVWSPHGTRLLYLRGVDDEVFENLWVMGARGRHKRFLLRGDDVRGFMDMSWAPRARRIALAVVGYYSDVHDLAIFNMKTRKLVRLHVFSGPRWHVSDVDWSPDGSRLIFSAWEDTGGIVPEYDLFSIRPNGTDLRRLTATPGVSEAGATWSPDGTRIAYAQFSDACTSSVMIAAPDATQAHRVPIGCGASSPDWAPGGHRLVVELSGPRHRNNIVLTRLDGSHRKVVGRGYAPTWRPR